MALNAAGQMMTAISYYLPLDRVTRALSLIRKGLPVPRGTLETVFVHQPFDELVRLGLTSQEEVEARTHSGDVTGLLTVASTVPNGSGATLLEPGDIVLRFDGHSIYTFTDVAEVLDAAVNESVSVEIQRGGKLHKFSLDVKDLHQITPKSYLQAGDCVFNDLSYHGARHYHLPIGGVYVAKAGYMLRKAGLQSGCIVSKIGDTPVNTVRELAAAMAKIPDNQKVPLRVASPRVPNVSATVLVSMERKWYPMRYVARDDATGAWVKHDAPDPPASATGKSAQPSSTTLPRTQSKTEKALAPSLVRVQCHLPLLGTNTSDSFVGTGLIVNAEKGLILVDRLTVPRYLGDFQVTFFDSIQVPAKVVGIHPIHNLAVVQYDPKLIGDTPVKACEFSTDMPDRDEKAYMVGIKGSSRSGSFLASCKGAVQKLQSQLPASLILATNLDVIDFSGPLASKLDGVLCNEVGKVFAYYGNFFAGNPQQGQGHLFFGIPADVILDFIRPLEKDEAPKFNMLGVRCEYLSLSQLRAMGLGDDLAHKIERQEVRKAVIVGQTFHSSPVPKMFNDGDVILSIDGKHVASLRDIDVAAKGKDCVDVVAFRDGKVVEFSAPTFDSFSNGLEMRSRLIQWAGAVVCEVPSIINWMHNASRIQGVWLDSFNAGSPAERHLQRNNLIVEVDSVPTPDLDTFLKVVSTKKDGQTIRIKQASIKTGATVVTTLTLDKQYWPVLTPHIMYNLAPLFQNGAKKSCFVFCIPAPSGAGCKRVSNPRIIFLNRIS